MAVKGITRRWLMNGLGLIVLLVVGVECALVFSWHSSYYNRLQQELSSRADALCGYFSVYNSSDTAEYERSARQFVEDFTDKESMELMMFNPSGEVLVTSTGFEPDTREVFPDYDAALASPEGVGVWQGKNSTGEQVLGVTKLLDLGNSGNRGAVRLVVSLEGVNGKLFVMIVAFLVMGMIVILVAIISGTYFLKSIVNPVQDIGKTAKRIAQGDFKARIEKRYDDEIGELCDTINYMAEELGSSERMKNDFISSVSHELRTPLTAIKGWAATMEEVDPEMDLQTYRKGMKVIERETERLSGIVEELLDFSRIQSGRMTLMMDRMDLLAELSEAVYMFQERAERDQISIEYQEPDFLIPVIGDKNRIKQIFVNILENAIKYSDPGGTIKVECFPHGAMLRTVITDNGCGISKEDLPKVKERFYKGNMTRAGSGIGLAVVDEIVKLHHGEFMIESELGIGTKVTIDIPAMQEKMQAADNILDDSMPVGNEPTDRMAVREDGADDKER